MNVEGTTATLLAAQASRVERVVFTSSIMAVGLGGDEHKKFDLFDMAGTYTMTKYLSERVAMRFARAGLPVVVVNPGMPFGPRNRAPTPTGQITLRFLKREVPMLGAGSLSVVDVDDCAEGHVLTEERGRVGERYILTGHDVTFRELAQHVARIANVRVPKVVLPRALGLPAVAAMEASRGARERSRSPPAERSVVHGGRAAFLERQGQARARVPSPVRSTRRSRGPSSISRDAKMA